MKYERYIWVVMPNNCSATKLTQNSVPELYDKTNENSLAQHKRSTLELNINVQHLSSKLNVSS